MSDEPGAHLDELCAEVEATEVLPLDREANRWLGEAQAVATDARDADLDPDTLRDRVETVRELLAEARPTGDDGGDEHVAAAIRHADAILRDD